MRGPRSVLLLLGVLILAVAGIVIWLWPRPAPSAGSAPAQATGGAARTPTGSARTPAAGRLVPWDPPDPDHRMLLGAFIDLSGQASTEAAVEQREAAMGRRYDLEITYYNWTDVFPDSGEAAIVAHGRTPVMTWYGPGKGSSYPHNLTEINDGSDDAWILRQAEAIKSFGHRIYLRLMPEMNGTWYQGYSGKPAAYVAAWRRVHGLFARAGADNVIWVWCPNVTPENSWDPYYPGNAYVDVIGVDGFSNPAYGWQSFGQMFGPFLAHYAGRKPLMIGETATDSGIGSPAAGIGSAATFISGMRTYLKDTAGPSYGLIAVCWFDTDIEKGQNWRVDQTPGAWQAWLALGRDPYFGGHGL